MLFIRKIFFVITALFLWLSAGPVQADSQSGPYTAEQFHTYWYTMGAEISRYALQQARYGEMHAGDAVLVFVTEKMNPVIQVKADHPGPADIPVLKLNSVRKFYTGIYPYSILTSVFAPVDAQKYPLPLKISSSIQEWCGHVYVQMNLKDGDYRVQLHSYFEKEGDQDFSVEKHFSEDAIWTLIRIAPSELPRGEFLMIPGTVYARLLHRPLKPVKAVATLAGAAEKSLEGNPMLVYSVIFPDEGRNLKIFFERDFPYRIQLWEDTYGGLFGKGHKTLTTRADRTHTIMTPYWLQHGNKDRKALSRLGLKP